MSYGLSTSDKTVILTEIINLHRSSYFAEGYGCGFVCYAAAFLEDLAYFGKTCFPFLAACADGSKLIVEDLEKELFNLNVSESAALIVFFHFIKA